MSKTCKHCRFFRADYGIWTATGWTGDGSTGSCQVEPRPVHNKRADDTCRHWESEAPEPARGEG